MGAEVTDPNLIADLIRAGVDPELVNRVSVGMMQAYQAGVSTRIPTEIHTDSTAEKRRAHDRERYRLRKNPTEIPPETTETTEIPKHTSIYKKEESKNLSKRVRATRIPPEWVLSEVGRKFAVDRGMQTARIPIEAEKFKNHWTAKSGATATSPDWEAKWRTWALRALEYQPGLPPPANPDAKPAYAIPPWEREGITEAQWNDRRLKLINGGKNEHAIPQVRGDSGMGQGGLYDASELRLPGGSVVRST